jgi:hypothetical protein
LTDFPHVVVDVLSSDTMLEKHTVSIFRADAKKLGSEGII